MTRLKKELKKKGYTTYPNYNNKSEGWGYEFYGSTLEFSRDGVIITEHWNVVTYSYRLLRSGEVVL